MKEAVLKHFTKESNKNELTNYDSFYKDKYNLDIYHHIVNQFMVVENKKYNIKARIDLLKYCIYLSLYYPDNLSLGQVLDIVKNENMIDFYLILYKKIHILKKDNLMYKLSADDDTDADNDIETDNVLEKIHVDYDFLFKFDYCTEFKYEFTDYNHDYNVNYNVNYGKENIFVIEGLDDEKFREYTSLFINAINTENIIQVNIGGNEYICNILEYKYNVNIVNILKQSVYNDYFRIEYNNPEIRYDIKIKMIPYNEFKKEV